MPSKLKFKGEKHRKRKRDDDGDESARPSKRRGEDSVDDNAWVFPNNINELRGPAFIYHPSEPVPICLTFNPTSNKLHLSLLLDKASTDDKPPPTILEREPLDVKEVWVITRVAGSETINLRTGAGEGKFLSCEKHGIVSADRDARGPQEEWTPVVLPDGMVAFQNIYEKYLGVDEVAGGSMALRGDSEQVGFSERFWVKVQSKYQREAKEEERKQKAGLPEPEIDEVGSNHMYQAWGAGRSVVSNDDKKALKRAKKEGRLAEAMLDRRAKLKSDRFC
ncbi:FRG1-like family-domain-containing protein [Flagelloscypha sp. PMI_526]|nr:FRG1-like family-domain-containing protein [Flagelloscypha sp. PMI_526]